MYLRDTIESIDVKGTSSKDTFMKIVTEKEGRILYEGKVKDCPPELKLHNNWIVTEIIRMEYWRGKFFLHIPKRNRPYRIEVCKGI